MTMRVARPREQGCKADHKSSLNPSPTYLSCPIYALHEGGSNVFEKFSITGVEEVRQEKKPHVWGIDPGMRVLIQELTS